jgi:hypothetical protein
MNERQREKLRDLRNLVDVHNDNMQSDWLLELIDILIDDEPPEPTKPFDWNDSD